ncbi:Hsp70 protein [Williamsia limnetica]|uniref:Hsp70 protein n=1 Tax=Williamsia limnetica TaxID=882452 RepID=A0A318RMF3_WILLI|nr:Hsp70 family protein [Williamsia limnetica]PYE18497.1 Hsp70 protein [Williamsia limnetica]
MSMHWWLAIDFGTSNTAAASYEPGAGAPQVVPLSHTSDIMSSSVYADSYRNIVVGEAAVNQATNNPAAFITHPKRHIAAGTVPVGNLDLPLENLIAAVLNSALTRAADRRGGTRPARLILTHPVAWSPEEIDVLTRAAELIGFDRSTVTLISEPRAAIAHYTRVTAESGSTIESKPGQTVAVVDYGGGTCDVAVVKISSPGAASGNAGPIDLIAHDGNNGLGGKNLDAMIRRWVDKQLTSRSPELLEYLRTSANLTTKRSVDDNIRRAKELLSESPRAVINISAGGHEAILELTRGEFEQLIAHNVDSVVDLTTRTLARAGAGKDVQIYLTGGSSRVPLVHQKLGELGTVATLDNPKTVVALGALEAIVSEGAAAPSVPAAVVPLSKPTPPPQAPWGAPTPPPTPAPSAQAWGGPNTPPPMPPPAGYGQQPSYASGPQPQYAGGPPYAGEPQYAGASQYAAGAQPKPPNPNRNRNLAIIAIGAVVVLIVTGIFGVALASSGDDSPKAAPTESSAPSTSSSATTTERVEPTTDTSTANASLNSDEQALADANVDLVDTDTCASIDSIDYALASIFCEPTPSVVSQGTTGDPASAIGLIEVVADTDIAALAADEHAASNTSQLFSQVVDGDTTYAYFDTFDDGTVAYIVYSPANGTVTWWMTDSTDQPAFAEWLKSAGLCLC